jgi:hypothetical protein
MQFRALLPSIQTADDPIDDPQTRRRGMSTIPKTISLGWSGQPGPEFLFEDRPKQILLKTRSKTQPRRACFSRHLARRRSSAQQSTAGNPNLPGQHRTPVPGALAAGHPVVPECPAAVPWRCVGLEGVLQRELSLARQLNAVEVGYGAGDGSKGSAAADGI